MTSMTQPRGTRPAFIAARWALRVVATVQALLMIGQPIWIGLYLAGSYQFRAVHAMAAGFLTLLGTLLLAVSVWYVIAGGRIRWLVVGLGFVLLNETQSAFGYLHLLAPHVPVGVGLVLAGVCFAVWVWTPGSGRVRARRLARDPGSERVELNRAAEQLVRQRSAASEADR